MSKNGENVVKEPLKEEFDTGNCTCETDIEYLNLFGYQVIEHGGVRHCA